MVKNLSAMPETRVWSLGREDPLKKEMAVHSSVLAWRIPPTEEPERLQSTGMWKVGHDWESNTLTLTDTQHADMYSRLLLFLHELQCLQASLVAQPGKLLSACNEGDLGSIPASGRCPGEGNGNLLQYSCLKIPWTEESGRLQPMGSQRIRHDWGISLHLRD